MEIAAILIALGIAALVLLVRYAKQSGKLKAQRDIAEVNRDKEERKAALDVAAPADDDDFLDSLSDKGVSNPTDM